MKEFDVVAAIIECNGKLLCMQRNVSKYKYVSEKFEFPGGKVEQGESYPQALMRELLEEIEMQTDVDESNYFMTTHFVYPDFSITLHTYRLRVDEPHFVLREHLSYVWALPKDMSKLDWAPADKEIVDALIGGTNG